jgi:hypothetical protein
VRVTGQAHVDLLVDPETTNIKVGGSPVRDRTHRRLGSTSPNGPWGSGTQRRRRFRGKVFDRTVLLSTLHPLLSSAARYMRLDELELADAQDLVE